MYLIFSKYHIWIHEGLQSFSARVPIFIETHKDAAPHARRVRGG